MSNCQKGVKGISKKRKDKDLKKDCTCSKWLKKSELNEVHVNTKYEFKTQECSI